MLTLLGIGALIAVVVILYLLCPEQHPDGSERYVRLASPQVFDSCESASSLPCPHICSGCVYHRRYVLTEYSSPIVVPSGATVCIATDQNKVPYIDLKSIGKWRG